MIKNFFIEHKIFLMLLLLIIFLAYFINIFINKHLIILAGEYIFSFDYLGHVRNILTDPRSILAADNTNCFDCPDFYHYSRWYSLFKIGYHGLSQVLFLHPFIFYLSSMVILQTVALYIFVRVLFKRFSWLPFFIATFVFIFYPYKYSLLVETHDGLLYSGMLVYFTLLIWTIKNLNSFSLKKNLFFGLVTGILLAGFLNINIAVFPIVFYTSVIILLVYRDSILSNKKKFVLFSFVTLLPAFVINIPFFQSLLLYGNTRHYEGYLSFNVIDSVLAGLFTAHAETFVVYGFGVLLLFCLIYAPIALKKKIYLCLFFVLLVYMIMGNNSPIPIYGWMFNNLPLLDSLRATYRFFFFEFVIFFVLIYLVLCRLQTEGQKQRIFFFVISFLFIFLSVYHIWVNKNYFFIATLPEEYFQTQKYINQFPDKKMYFPPTTPLFYHNLATDYTWANPNYNESILLYKNPFTSLLPVRNLIQVERFPYLLSSEYLELRYLTDLKQSPEEIIRAMELRRIHYVIVDMNYRWATNYPDFDLTTFMKLAPLEKQFGNLSVFKLPDKSDECKKGYGTITVEYCTTLNGNPVLLNKTQEEYLLETAPGKIGTTLHVRKNSTYTKSVLDPQLQQSLIDTGSFFTREIMQVFGEQKNVFFTDSLTQGSYTLYISLFKYPREKEIMGKTEIVVRTANKTIKHISPYAEKPGFYWEKITVKVNNEERISIDMDNKGYVIVGFIPRLKAL